MQNLQPIMADIVAGVADTSKQIASNIWDIAVSGVRAEGITLLLLTIVSAILAIRAISFVFKAEKLVPYKNIFRGLLSLTGALEVFHLRDPLIMIIAPKYFIVKSTIQTAVTTGTSPAIQLPLPIQSSVLMPLFGLVLVILTAVGIIYWKEPKLHVKSE